MKNVGNIVKGLQMGDRLATKEETKEMLDFLGVKKSWDDKSGGFIINENLRIHFPMKTFFWKISFVHGNVDLKGCGLLDIENVPDCSGALDVSGCKIKSINKLPKFNGNLSLRGNPLIGFEFLDGMSINGTLDVSDTPLIGLSRIAAKKIVGDFIAERCSLTSGTSNVLVDGVVLLNDNFLTFEPKVLASKIFYDNNPVNPSDEFEGARW